MPFSFCARSWWNWYLALFYSNILYSNFYELICGFFGYLFTQIIIPYTFSISNRWILKILLTNRRWMSMLTCKWQLFERQSKHQIIWKTHFSITPELDLFEMTKHLFLCLTKHLQRERQNLMNVLDIFQP